MSVGAPVARKLWSDGEKAQLRLQVLDRVIGYQAAFANAEELLAGAQAAYEWVKDGK
ncbi:hypothetical protein [Mycobacterium sp. AZCC_0083]|uniref:hypothetical protein n=1 Tax=Mycobacterium sp. AZCC_0083 TaxID=2735882 RepID=UPI001612A026|nr:hypothetical protein [Mycobacterium sp. AZCC_0083]MBB5167167.1 hypothetical protein [Mycobacterium sp. AZCC_0083]